eukprot:TRINITY_DN568_c0_g1_i10.p3 TRINITY_DN568_c0_g1~~TRINITY_DN568_c0_g1_i10.p3  ORF type:complete len:170 (-),score=30.27 TRINITY_DN568_c0_g1_i10:272-781(-)
MFRQRNAKLMKAAGLMHMRGIIEFGEALVKDEFWTAKWATVDRSNAVAVAAFNKWKKGVAKAGRVGFWTALTQETDPSVLAGEKVKIALAAVAVYGKTGPADVAAAYRTVSGDVHDPHQDALGRFLIDSDRVGMQTAKFMHAFCGVIPVEGYIIGDGKRMSQLANDKDS